MYVALKKLQDWPSNTSCREALKKNCVQQGFGKELIDWVWNQYMDLDRDEQGTDGWLSIYFLDDQALELSPVQSMITCFFSKSQERCNNLSSDL